MQIKKTELKKKIIKKNLKKRKNWISKKLEWWSNQLVKRTVSKKE